MSSACHANKTCSCRSRTVVDWQNGLDCDFQTRSKQNVCNLALAVIIKKNTDKPTGAPSSPPLSVSTCRGNVPLLNASYSFDVLFKMRHSSACRAKYTLVRPWKYSSVFVMARSFMTLLVEYNRSDFLDWCFNDSLYKNLNLLFALFLSLLCLISKQLIPTKKRFSNVRLPVLQMNCWERKGWRVQVRIDVPWK